MPRQRQQPKRPRLKRVSIRADRHDKPDWDRYAWALLQHTKIVRAREEAERAKKGRSPS